jgi:hypothetical protein
MVINQINIDGVATLEAENRPPIAGNGNRIKTGHVSLELVELQAGKVHIFSREGRIQQTLGCTAAASHGIASRPWSDLHKRGRLIPCAVYSQSWDCIPRYVSGYKAKRLYNKPLNSEASKAFRKLVTGAAHAWDLTQGSEAFGQSYR